MHIVIIENHVEVVQKFINMTWPPTSYTPKWYISTCDRVGLISRSSSCDAHYDPLQWSSSKLSGGAPHAAVSTWCSEICWSLEQRSQVITAGMLQPLAASIKKLFSFVFYILLRILKCGNNIVVGKNWYMFLVKLTVCQLGLEVWICR